MHLNSIPRLKIRTFKTFKYILYFTIRQVLNKHLIQRFARYLNSTEFFFRPLTIPSTEVHWKDGKRLNNMVEILEAYIKM